jgi:hypothetical protein
MEGSQASDAARRERLAYNEALNRQLNERKAKWIENRLPTAGFRCECATLYCGARFRLSPEQWEEARSKSDRFVVAPEHLAPDLEVVVEEYPNYWLIEKRGVAAEIAEEMA